MQKKTLIYLTILFTTCSLFLTSIIMLSNNNTNSSLSNKSNNAGMGVTSMIKDNIDSKDFNLIDWDNDAYKNLIKKYPSNYDKKYFVNELNTNGNSTFPVQANVPNTGSALYTGNIFGSNILETTTWNKAVPASYLKQSDGNPISSIDPSKINDLKISSPQRSLLNLGLDFGTELNVDSFYKGSFATPEKTATRYLIDSSNLLSNFNLPESDNDPNLVSPPKNSDNPTKPNSYSINYLFPNNAFKNIKYINSGNLLHGVPFTSSKMTINKDTDTQQSFQISVFGMKINGTTPKYLTFIFEKNLYSENTTNNNIYAKNFDQEHLIIDENANSVSQENELNNIFSISNHLKSDAQNENYDYDNDTKTSLINDINGSSQNLDWNINERVALSLVNKNNLNDVPKASALTGVQLTASKYDKHNPNIPLKDGYNPKDFANSVLLQNWDKKINARSLLTKLFSFQTRFDMKKGYNRDLSNFTNDRLYYAPQNYLVNDIGNIYTNAFVYNSSFNNGLWKKNSESSKFQTLTKTNTVYNSSSISPMQTSIFSTYNPESLQLIDKNNESLSDGAIVAAVLSGVVILPSIFVGYGFYKYSKKIAKK